MGLEPLFLTKLVLIALVIIAMLSDLVQMRIPNVISVAIIFLFPVAFLGGETPPPILDHVGAMLVVLVAGIILFAFKILGGGDVKFLSSLALWTGFGLLPSFVVILSLVGGVQVVLILVLRKYSDAIEYLLANTKIVLPEWFHREGGVPYGLSIGIAILIIFERLPFWAS